MVRWLLPREETFYSLIERQCETLDKAAQALAQFADGTPAEEVHQTVLDLEHQADELVYQVEERFAEVFVTPIDREDIQALVVSIDDIVDLLNLTARTFVLYDVPEPTAPMVELMRLLVTMAAVLRAEIPGILRSFNWVALNDRLPARVVPQFQPMLADSGQCSPSCHRIHADTRPGQA